MTTESEGLWGANGVSERKKEREEKTDDTTHTWKLHSVTHILILILIHILGILILSHKIIAYNYRLDTLDDANVLSQRYHTLFCSFTESNIIVHRNVLLCLFGSSFMLNYQQPIDDEHFKMII